MDRVDTYRQIVRKVLNDYSDPPSNGDIKSEIIIDPVNDHYELAYVGWDRHRRVHGPVLHLDIIDGKIWIQHDGTDRPVARELQAAGVPREDIVLAFYPREDRELTGYAVG
jgi:hypothetical protein